MERLEPTRILMYSHDTFGLGHLTRTRTIAHALVERYKGLSILIVTGSPIAGNFSFRNRVDFVKIPSVIKLRNGEYTSIGELIDLHDIIEIRKSIIRHTVESFKPDMVIVDKEPMGLKGELEDTLRFLDGQGTKLVLGLRDVMDSPDLLYSEWQPNDVIGKIDAFYDHIWIYGTREVWHPLQGLDIPASLKDKIKFTGYLKRQLPTRSYAAAHSFTNPYVLVTVGGGGDGAELMDWVLRAYNHDHTLPYPALLVLGPFMQTHIREQIRQRADALDNVEAIDFESNMGQLMAGAIGVVAMGGYNTFCEILSFDKRAIIYPRTHPRKEQLVRAERAAKLGLVGFLDPDRVADPEFMVRALRDLPSRLQPSETEHRELLNGLETIGDAVGEVLASEENPSLTLIDNR